MSVRIYGNRELKTLPTLATRPTLAIVRQAVFNVWQGTIEGCRWLDLCCGCGSMGGEALCREAAMVVGIDRSPVACRLVRENWQRLAAADRFEVVCGDLVKKMAILAGERFDRIYFDPPYVGDLYLPVMSAIVAKDILAIDGEMAVESAANFVLPVIEGLRLVTRKKYGNTAVSFYRIEADI